MSDYIKTSNTNRWYTSAMERLVEVVQELSRAKTIEEVTEIVRVAALELTKADGATFVMRDGKQCYYAEENSLAPLWKGMRFPISACVSGWAMLHGQSVVIEDIYKDSRIPHDAYKPTYVKSLVMVPIRQSAPIGAIGNYWATKRMPSEEEVAILQALADTTSVALENIKLYSDLKSQVEIVQEREKRISNQRDKLEIFTRALAHDLKEPIRTVNSFSELVMHEGNLTGKSENYFSHINLASQRMLTLVETVLNYMQLENEQEMHTEMCEMNKILIDVNEKLSTIIKERGAQITFDTLPVIKGNSLLLSQLLFCLLSNALTHNDSAPKIHISSEQQGDFWLFKVTDNGCGIDKADSQKIFLPFKRASEFGKGIGMGLAICKKIVDVHHGEIWCESILEEGSTFIFTIPIGQENSEQKIKATLANLLLVDDMKSDIELTETIMERSKIQCNLYIARSGNEALEVLRRKINEKDPIDLVLLDINMPKMDGFETLEKIKEDNSLAQIAVVMCTGSTYDKDKEKAESLGAKGYIVKPVRKESLEDVMTNISNLQTHKTTEGYCIQRKIS